jgi:Helix-turn-helix domain
MSDNKSEGAGVADMHTEPSPTVIADGESKPEIATARESSQTAAKESPPAPASSIHPDGGASVAKEQVTRADQSEQSLGTFLIAAREGRGLTADDVVRETRLPQHYLRMMETNDYSKISDQLYLVPFLRRYASFLELDQEDVAMRFVREVQRVDGNPGPPRLDQPLVAESHQHRGWTGAIVVVGSLVLAACVYVYESNRHRQVTTDTMMPHASAGVATGSDAPADSTAPQAAR